jgi:hypothetical protein
MSTKRRFWSMTASVCVASNTLGECDNIGSVNTACTKRCDVWCCVILGRHHYALIQTVTGAHGVLICVLSAAVCTYAMVLANQLTQCAACHTYVNGVACAAGTGSFGSSTPQTSSTSYSRPTSPWARYETWTAPTQAVGGVAGQKATWHTLLW